MLMQGPKDANGLISRPTILFFDGDKAAIAAKQARPLDLHTISVRNGLRYVQSCLHSRRADILGLKV